MKTIGLIREGKVPQDNRVAFTPAQCKWMQKNIPGLRVVVQTSENRCYSDREYASAGIEVREDMTDCDILFGIKEIPIDMLIPAKTYLFFSHTKKKQLYNQKLFQSILQNKITLIDYECLEHEDGQRILGFGFFAGVVGAHNGIMAYGNRTNCCRLPRVYEQKSFRELIHTYFGLKLPNIKIVITGSGRVAHGVLEIMNLLEVIEVEPEEFLQREFSYPVFTQLKGANLYQHGISGTYNREHFHENATEYVSKFLPYARVSDILMNGTYWDSSVPRLFEATDITDPDFKIVTIADITDDKHGSVPINLGDATIEDPVYGVDRLSGKLTDPYIQGSIDIMAVGNLPNELPRDASQYFGEQLIKHVVPQLLNGGSDVLERATMVRNGEITEGYAYLEGYGRE